MNNIFFIRFSFKYYIWTTKRNKNKKRFDTLILLYQTHSFNMVVCTGFEPVSVALRGQCVKPLHQQTNCLYSLAQTLKEINIRLPAKYKILDSLSH